MNLLTIDLVTKRFGGLTAVDAVTFAVEAGSITGLIGPNGAGKSTLFDLLSGAQKPTAGTITFAGREVTGWAPHQAAAAGLARTFQLMRVFGSRTVLDNVMAASYLQHRRPAAARAAAESICAEFGLAELAGQRAATLTGASRKRLELARAMATEPKILLLDEVLSGLTPSETDTAIDLIQRIHATGVTILLVEHVMQVVMSLCTNLVVMDFGKVIFTGSPQDAVIDQAVLDAYLGA